MHTCRLRGHQRNCHGVILPRKESKDILDSDLHLLSPTSGAPVPPALPRPDHPHGPQGPRHHQPMHRSPTGLRAGHGESLSKIYLFFTLLSGSASSLHLSS
ncbi:hypothetical protein GOODEAATRI_011814 [Goodea atripinnis]|uniref:Uncharacterized protein n=1 Tax=Goodea atripinnis TaxID=208336 RepID=A0ABV0PMS3_9TELE